MNLGGFINYSFVFLHLFHVSIAQIFIIIFEDIDFSLTCEVDYRTVQCNLKPYKKCLAYIPGLCGVMNRRFWMNEQSKYCSFMPKITNSKNTLSHALDTIFSTQACL